MIKITTQENKQTWDFLCSGSNILPKSKPTLYGMSESALSDDRLDLKN
jgi:hypothetical protein